MFTETQEKLAAALVDGAAIKFGQFRLKLHEEHPDAPLSPIYVDLRILRSLPDAMDLAVAVYRELTNGLRFDVYADIPTAATPFAALLSHETRRPMISPRMDKKGHGSGSPIDGIWKPGQTALVMDDLITKADSKLEAIRFLENNGLRVKDVVVLIDREQGGPDQLQKQGYKCHCAYRLKELLKFCADSGKISHADYERTMKYLST